MTRVAIDRTENDPDIFRQVLEEFEKEGTDHE